MLYAIIRSLQSIHNEYQFSLDYFVKLFDEAVGGELPDDFGHGLATEEVYIYVFLLGLSGVYMSENMCSFNLPKLQYL